MSSVSAPGDVNLQNSVWEDGQLRRLRQQIIVEAALATTTRERQRKAPLVDSLITSMKPATDTF